jgi:hypothetical protein
VAIQRNQRVRSVSWHIVAPTGAGVDSFLNFCRQNFL